MILGNVSQFNLGSHRHLGAFGDRYTNYKPSTWHNFFFPDTTTTSTVKSTSFPTGTEPPYSWIVGEKGGELSSTVGMSGLGSIVSNLTNGKGLEANIGGGGSLSATVSLLYQLVASLSGAGSLSGSLSSALGLSANLSGAGSLSATVSLLQAMAASLSGSGIIVANLKQVISMEADIFVNSGTATVNELVAGVWGAVAADFNESGTMGQKLNGAGSAGDPWTTDLSGYNTSDTAGKILKEAHKKAKGAYINTI